LTLQLREKPLFPRLDCLMNRNKHCEKCVEILGESFGFIHDWLDEFGDGNYAHRAHRHHIEGIEEVRKRWGTRAAIAARIHIGQDWGHVPAKSDYDDIKSLKLTYFSLRGFEIPKNI